jgi:hypothetical protein
VTTVIEFDGKTYDHDDLWMYRVIPNTTGKK